MFHHAGIHLSFWDRILLRSSGWPRTLLDLSASASRCQHFWPPTLNLDPSHPKVPRGLLHAPRQALYHWAIYIPPPPSWYNVSYNEIRRWCTYSCLDRWLYPENNKEVLQVHDVYWILSVMLISTSWPPHSLSDFSSIALPCYVGR